MKMYRSRGFALVELLIVVAIIGILASIAFQFRGVGNDFLAASAYSTAGPPAVVTARGELLFNTLSSQHGNFGAGGHQIYQVRAQEAASGAMLVSASFGSAAGSIAGSSTHVNYDNSAKGPTIGEIANYAPERRNWRMRPLLIT